jgi:hypothetical protein
MDDIKILLLGETGGAMALCFLTGVGVGWMAYHRWVATQLYKELERLRAKVDELWQRARFD